MDDKRTQRVASAVTEHEREALGYVAKVRGVTVSELLRVMSVEQAVEEYGRLLGILPRGAA